MATSDSCTNCITAKYKEALQHCIKLDIYWRDIYWMSDSVLKDNISL